METRTRNGLKLPFTDNWSIRKCRCIIIIFYSGNAGVPRIEPETYLKGKGNIMLSFHYITGRAGKTAQERRFADITKARKGKNARKKKRASSKA